jgi:hypothetical protein
MELSESASTYEYFENTQAPIYWNDHYQDQLQSRTCPEETEKQKQSIKT